MKINRFLWYIMRAILITALVLLSIIAYLMLLGMIYPDFNSSGNSILFALILPITALTGVSVFAAIDIFEKAIHPACPKCKGILKQVGSVRNLFFRCTQCNWNNE